MSTTAAPLVRSFAPLFRADARVLVLGSMPGTASLAAAQYYAHPRNAFWPIMGALFGAGAELPYAQRLERLAAAGVALWDVIGRCERAGSLDSAIRDAVANPLAGLKESAPALRRICFNGRMAARRIRDVEALGYEALVLPSTSPAHAGMTFEEKLARWRTTLHVDVVSRAGQNDPLLES